MSLSVNFSNSRINETFTFQTDNATTTHQAPYNTLNGDDANVNAIGELEFVIEENADVFYEWIMNANYNDVLSVSVSRDNGNEEMVVRFEQVKLSSITMQHEPLICNLCCIFQRNEVWTQYNGENEPDIVVQNVEPEDIDWKREGF